jgi:ketosteroid isomerase-like protein
LALTYRTRCKAQTQEMDQFPSAMNSLINIRRANSEAGEFPMDVPARPTRYDPSPDDPRIVAALAARAALDHAMAAGDVSTIATLFAEDLVIQIPRNRVVDRARILAAYGQGGQALYQSGLTLILDFVGVRQSGVVMMGEERVEPPAPIRRRFTDIWNDIGGAWKLTIRQATNIPFEQDEGSAPRSQ